MGSHEAQRSSSDMHDRGRSASRPGGERFVVPSVAALGTLLVASSSRDFVHPDWQIARDAGHTLLSADGLHVYGLHPRAQMGPLSLLVDQLPRVVVLGLVALSVGPVLVWLRDAAGSSTRATPPKIVFALAGGLLVVPWSQLAWKGHADDALVLLGAAWVLRERAAGRHGRTLAGYAVAVAAKPTAIVLFPLMLTSLPVAVGAGALTAAIWGPFAVADAGALLEAGRGVMSVDGGSLPDLLGHQVGDAMPKWVRPAQLLLGLAAAAWGVRVARPAEGLLLALTVRALLDPNPAPAYAIPLVALSTVPDLRRADPSACRSASLPRGLALRSLPVHLGLASVAFWTSQPVLNGGPAWPRLLALAALATTTGWLMLPGHRGAAARLSGRSDHRGPMTHAGENAPMRVPEDTPEH